MSVLRLPPANHSATPGRNGHSIAVEVLGESSTLCIYSHLTIAIKVNTRCEASGRSRHVEANQSVTTWTVWTGGIRVTVCVCVRACVRACVRILSTSLSSNSDFGRHDEECGLHSIPVSGEVHSFRMSSVERLCGGGTSASNTRRTHYSKHSEVILQRSRGTTAL